MPVYESVVGTPHPALRGLVARYIGYRLDGYPPGIHYALPSGTLTFVVALDEPLRMPELPDRHRGPVACDVLVGGLHDRRGLIAHQGRQHGVQVELHPLGSRQLLAAPAAALANEVIDAGGLLGPAAAELHNRISEASDWPGRFAVLDDLFLRRLSERARPVRTEIAWSWAQLSGSGGRVAVADLADEIGWSRRHFTAQFTAELGLAPKTAARMVRFERARRMLGRPGPTSIAEVAATCGYADQSHLTRDFRAIVDRTPTQLFREDPTLAGQLDVAGTGAAGA